MDDFVDILHCHSTFTLGGKEARAVRLMNAFGKRARHTVLSAMPQELSARALIDGHIHADFPIDAPPLAGRPSVGRYEALAAYSRRFDLVLTYNWGAMDMVMALRLNPRGCPPLVHHEDGFNEDEIVRLKWERNLFRRIALRAAHAVAVPSVRLETIARETWKQPAGKVVRIGNGIATGHYAKKPAANAVPGWKKKPGRIAIGTLAGLRPVKNLPLLVRAARRAGLDADLVIVGDGEERVRIRDEAVRQGIAERLVLPGFLDSPHRFMRLFDIFALSSDSEQFPISVVEAMAAGLPVAATDVGDVRAMVAPENLPFIVPVGDETALAEALAKLGGDARLRHSIGQANQIRAAAEFDERETIGRYAALYEDAIGVPGALTEV